MSDYLLAAEPLSGADAHEAGRRLLARLYTQRYGKSLPPIEKTPAGKPYFSGNEAYFSISHTQKNVFCVLSDRPVGLDAEEADRPVKSSLAKRILSPKELARYEQAQDPRLALLTFWVLKEAAAKLSGDGIKGYPNHTDFNLTDRRVQQLNGCVVAVVEGGPDAV
jgi:phosphopantetheine--protein transferase-like protein